MTSETLAVQALQAREGTSNFRTETPASGSNTHGVTRISESAAHQPHRSSHHIRHSQQLNPAL